MASKSFIDLAGLQHYDEKLQERLENYVTLAGTQSISGAKTFTTYPAISMTQPAIVISNSNLTKGTNPSSTAYANIFFQDKTTGFNTLKRISSLDAGVTTAGQTELSMRVFDWGQETNTNGAISIYYPKGETPYTAAPTPATSDNSTKIATTAYVKAQGYLTSHQSLANYVTLDGTQTISGAKTFTSDITLNSRQINNASCIEFKPTSATANHGGYLDFHYNQSSSDYTSRIIESASGTISINNVTITSGKVVTATTFTGALSGNASTATKLQTARTIDSGSLEFQGSANFDGSGNISLNVTQHRCIVGVGNTNNYSYHRIAYIPTLSGNYQDRGITFLISKDYSGGGWGICRIILRTNNAGAGGTASLNVQWLVRSSELPANSIQAGFCNAANASYVDIFYKSGGGYNSAICRVLAHSNGRSSVGRGFTVIASSTEASNTTASDPLTSVESYASIEAAGTALHEAAYTSIIAASDVGLASNVTGTVAIANGGTGATTAASALTNLGAAASSHTHDYLPISGGSLTGDLKISTSTQNQLRLVQGNYGVIFRNDGSNFYLLKTESGSAENGGWDSTRPLIVNLSTGTCSINGNAATATKAGGLSSASTPIASGLTYASGGFTLGSSAGQLFKGSSNDATLLSAPESGTYYSSTAGNVQNLRLTWSSDGKYFTDIFASPNNDFLWHRNVVNTTARPWRRLVEENATGITSPSWNISISGNAGTATKAAQDASGNVITTTYATKAELADITSVTTTQIDTLFV